MLEDLYRVIAVYVASDSYRLKASEEWLSSILLVAYQIKSSISSSTTCWIPRAISAKKSGLNSH